MGKSKQGKTRRISVAKKVLTPNDPRLKVTANSYTKEKEKEAKAKKIRAWEAKTGKKWRESDDKSKDTFDGQKLVHVEQGNTNLFFSYNNNLGPPYRILIDTNFINFSIQNKLDLFNAMMDCLLAKCIPIITDCVMAELEKLGIQYRIALRIAKDPRIERYPCNHSGTYADDCLVNRVTQHRCYIVATCDKDLKRRLRKVPGVPIMYITQRKYSIERFPDANDAPDK
jgi:U3 small nucleolar RNA-associated protein 24